MAGLTFVPFARGIELAEDDNFVHLRMTKDRAKGEPSSTGKTLVTGSTSSWLPTPSGFRVMAQGGWSAKK